MLANCRSQYLLDGLGRYLKLFVSTDIISCHEFASQFRLDFFIREKHPKLSRIPRRTRYCIHLNEAATGHSTSAKRGVNFVMVGRTDPSNSDNHNGDGGGLVSACARVCVLACVCVRVCMRA